MRRLLVAVVLLPLLAVAGCGGSRIPVNQASSPLGNGGDNVIECAPDPSRQPVANGLTELENRSSSTVVVEHVSFYGARHVRLIRAVIVPVHLGSLGMSLSWPPIKPDLDQPGVEWKMRVPAVGAVVPPDTGRNGRRNLVIEMQPTAREDDVIAGVQIRYRAAGKEYELRTHTAVKVLVTRKCL